jgi:hypothetical protein
MKFLSSCVRRNFILKQLACCLYQHLLENPSIVGTLYVQLIKNDSAGMPFTFIQLPVE